MEKKLLTILLTTAFVILVAIIFLQTLDPNFDSAQITIGNGTQLDVLVADTGKEHAQGLSNINLEEFEQDGMLFVFDDAQVRDFWMHKMLFDLDVLWIADGVIVKIDRSIEAPKDDDKIARMSSVPYEADMVLELPASGASFGQFSVGERIEVVN